MRLPCSEAMPPYSTPSGTAIDSRHLPKSSTMSCENSGSMPRALKASRFSSMTFRPTMQVADVLLHQVGDVVVAHEQHVERHVLAVAHELILAAAVLEAAADQQVERVVGQAAGLLQRDLQAGGFVHGEPTSVAVL